MNSPRHDFDPITGFSHDRIRRICSGEDLGPLPPCSEPFVAPRRRPWLVTVAGIAAAFTAFVIIAKGGFS